MAQPAPLSSAHRPGHEPTQARTRAALRAIAESLVVDARAVVQLAHDAGVRMLALTHLSTRYFPREVRDEARGVFENSTTLRLEGDDPAIGASPRIGTRRE